MENYPIINHQNQLINGIPFKLVLTKLDHITLEAITCPICQKLVWEMIDCSQCGYIFCRNCINESFNKTANTCPMCRQSPFQKTKCMTIKKMLNNIQLRCPNYPCKETPFYSDFAMHLKKCKFKPYYCINEGCNYINTMNNQNDIISHSKQCPYRKINCYFCGNIIRVIDIQDHEKNACKEIEVCQFCFLKMRKYDYQNNHDELTCLQYLTNYCIMNSEIKNQNIASSLKNRIDKVKNTFFSQIGKLQEDNKILYEKYRALFSENQKLRQDIINCENNYRNLEKKSMLKKKRKRANTNKEQ